MGVKLRVRVRVALRPSLQFRLEAVLVLIRLRIMVRVRGWAGVVLVSASRWCQCFPARLASASIAPALEPDG